MWVKGSGSDLATMEREHFTGAAARRDAAAVRARRDDATRTWSPTSRAASSTRAMPRASIETLLHAFVPAPHVHHTHPDAINVIAGTRDGERLVAECFGDEAAWIPYIRPGFTLVQAGRRGGAREPGPEARGARQARPRGLGRQRRGGLPAHDRGHQPGGRVRQRAHRRHAALRRRRPRPTTSAASLLARAAARAARRGLERARARCSPSTPRRASLEFVSSRAAPSSSSRSARACPDHLVHTKRAAAVDPVRPGADDADALRERIARARGGVPRASTARTSSATATRRPSRPTPTRASC